jgi:hypothetical protein
MNGWMDGWMNEECELYMPVFENIVLKHLVSEWGFVFHKDLLILKEKIRPI